MAPVNDQSPAAKPADAAAAALDERKRTQRIQKDAFVAGAAGLGFTLIGLGFNAYCNRFTTDSLAYNRLDSVGPFLMIIGILLIVLALVWLIWAWL